MDKPVIILGAGGHAKTVADVLLQLNWNIIGFVSPENNGASDYRGIHVIGDDEVLSSYSPDNVVLVNGIGTLPNKHLRWNLAAKMRHAGYKFNKVVHPSAIISSDVELDEGVHVMAGAVIQPGTKIGRDSIINTGACIDHDCTIGLECHIAPGVTISGGCCVGEKTHIGTGTVIIQNISIGNECVIAAGSVIYKNIESNSTFIQPKQSILK